MRLTIKQRVATSALSLMLLLTFNGLVEAQIAATTSIFLSAKLPGQVSLSTRSIPISILVSPGQPHSAQIVFPLKVAWNLDPREVQGFEVVSYFANPRAALVSGATSIPIPAEHVLGRWGTEAFRPFNESGAIGPAGSSLRLLKKSIFSGDSRGDRDDMLNVLIDPAFAATIKGGEYTGVLYVEFRYY